MSRHIPSPISEIWVHGQGARFGSTSGTQKSSRDQSGGGGFHFLSELSRIIQSPLLCFCRGAWLALGIASCLGSRALCEVPNLTLQNLTDQKATPSAYLPDGFQPHAMLPGPDPFSTRDAVARTLHVYPKRSLANPLACPTLASSLSLLPHFPSLLFPFHWHLRQGLCHRKARQRTGFGTKRRSKAKR